MYSISNYGNIKNILTGNMLHPWKCKNGYLYATLMTKDKTAKSIGVHILVAEHFCEKPKELLLMNEKLVPNHDDFNKENNYYKNLTWMTYAMNNEWNIKHGHVKEADKAPNSKVKNELVEKICELMSEGYLNKEIMNILDIERNAYSISLLTRIRNGTQWKSISSKYNITNRNTLRKYDDDFIKSVCELIEHGFTLPEMREKLRIDENSKSKEKFRKLVWGLRNRTTYKYISKDYTW